MSPNFCQSLNGSPVKFHLSPFEVLQRSQFWSLNVAFFLHFEVYLVSDNFLFLLFQFGNFALHPWTLSIFSKFKKKIFLIFFLKRIRCSKYKQQGIVKVLISYQIQNLQCSLYKIATYEAFLINTKILSFSKKLENYASYKKKIPRIKTFFFHVLHLSSKFKSFRFNNKKNLKLNRSPLIDNTNELIRKILSEQLHNQIIYAR